MANGGAVIQGKDFGLLLHIEAVEVRHGVKHGQAVGAVFQVAQTQSLQTAAKPHGKAVLVLPNMRQLVYQPGAFDQGALGEIGAEPVGGEVNMAEGGNGNIAGRQPPRATVQADAFIAQPAAKHAAGEFGFGGGERAGTWGHGWFINP